MSALTRALAVSLALGVAPRVAVADDTKVRFEAETSGYQDSDATSVITPGVRAEVLSVTQGWGVGAGFMVDVVTAASADIVATASPKWIDTRYVPSLDGRFKVGDATLGAAVGASVESDYYAGTGSLSFSIDLAEKTITPSFSYSFGYDVAARRGTPLSVYSLELMRHALSASVTFVVNKSTIFVPGLAAVLELGDQEKPYRYLPTFAPGTDVPNGATRDEVDALRTSMRVAENSPNTRHRYAGSALVAHRFDNATVRVEERLYMDSWFLMATTTDFTLPVDVGDGVRLWPHARFHAQKGVSFWERAYEATPTAQGLAAPLWRVGDRELGPMIAATLGGGIRFFSDRVGVTIAADAIYTRFLDQIFIQQRLAGFGAVTFDVETE
jgi:hypothetical protein